MGEVAHIRGESDGSARHDRSMSDADRKDVSNVFLLCPTHHKLIDDIEAERHTVEILHRMKEAHEQRCADSAYWARDDELTRYAALVLQFQFEIRPEPRGLHDTAGATDDIFRPGLTLERLSDGSLVIVNRGQEVASKVRATVVTGDAGQVDLASIQGSSLDPGGSLRSGQYLRRATNADLIIRIDWTDAGGRARQIDFPLGPQA